MSLQNVVSNADVIREYSNWILKIGVGELRKTNDGEVVNYDRYLAQR